jgi:type I restriction enzyme S subunit
MGHSDFLKSQGMSIIPSEWRNVHLTEVVDFYHGKAHEQYIAEFGKYLLVNSKFISTNGMVLKRTDKNFLIAKRHDVLTVLSDLPNGRALAKTFLVEENDLYAVNQRICIWRAKANTWGPFIHYAMNRHKHFLSLDDGVSQTHILNRHISTCQLIIPPLKEQKAIAQVLSDFDNLIDSLERLIAKKRSIKQVVMQELLRPKEGWTHSTLGELVQIKKGQLITGKTRVRGDIPVIAGGKTPAYYHNKANRIKKTITISASGSAGYVSFHDYPIFASDCLTIEEHDDYAIHYVYYLLKSLQEKIYKLQTGGAQPHVYPRDLQSLEVFFPIKEIQIEIAQTLAAMELEMSTIQSKILKYRQIKDGMTSQLLTGKTRLV